MKVIIIGATSGIGRELAQCFSKSRYIVGITGRRTHLLDTLEKELPNQCFKSFMDLEDVHQSICALKELIKQMGGVDIIVINAGVGSVDPNFPLSDELKTIAVNVAGFTAIANTAYHYFSTRNKGHIVGISSVAAIRGGTAASYHASKAYISSYLEGLSCRAYLQEKNIDITDIRPGFVDTAMVKGEAVFWKASLKKAAKQIIYTIKRRRRISYITKRWRLIGWALPLLPFVFYRKIIK